MRQAYSEWLVTTIIQKIEKGPIPATFIGMYIHKRPVSYSCMYFSLDSFHRQYVADKTANVIVVCRKYYLQVVNGAKAYTEVATPYEEII